MTQAKSQQLPAKFSQKPSRRSFRRTQLPVPENLEVGRLSWPVGMQTMHSLNIWSQVLYLVLNLHHPAQSQDSSDISLLICKMDGNTTLVIMLLPCKIIGKIRLLHATLSEECLEQTLKYCCKYCSLDPSLIIGTKPEAYPEIQLQTLQCQFVQFYKSWLWSPLVLSLYCLWAREDNSMENALPSSSQETGRNKVGKSVNWLPKHPYVTSSFCT